MIDVKILAGYLPYNLQFEGGGDIWTMAGLRTNGDVVLRNGLHTQAIPAEVVGLEYKPMLQKIEGLDDEQRESFRSVTPRAYAATWKNTALVALKQAQWFLEHHYDIHDLFGKGLAVRKRPQP